MIHRSHKPNHGAASYALRYRIHSRNTASQTSVTVTSSRLPSVTWPSSDHCPLLASAQSVSHHRALLAVYGAAAVSRMAAARAVSANDPMLMLSELRFWNLVTACTWHAASCIVVV